MHEKQKVIKREGTPVTITVSESYINDEGVGGVDDDGNLIIEPVDTTAVIGRATTQFDRILALESHRKGHFLPDVELKPGFMVRNNYAQEDYLIVATYPEIYRETVLCNVTQMVQLNCFIWVKREIKTVDVNGVAKKEITSIVNSRRCHLQSKIEDLKSYDVGINPNCTFVIYCSYFSASELDVVTIEYNGKILPVKVVSYDILSYSGIILLYLKSETRK